MSCMDYSKEYVETLQGQNQTDHEKYKDDFRGMIIGSLTAIHSQSKAILDRLSDPTVNENLTEPFLQGMSAIAEDYVNTIHNFVIYSKKP
jgi:hypothetical protein